MSDLNGSITYNPTTDLLSVVSATISNTLIVNSFTTATSTTTGSLQVKGGAGVGGSVYVGNRVGWVNPTTNVSAFYTYYNTVTNSLDTIFG